MIKVKTMIKIRLKMLLLTIGFVAFAIPGLHYINL